MRSRRALFRRLPDGVLLLALHGDEVVELSGTGVPLWELLAEPVSLAAAAHSLAERFGVDVLQVQGQITPILRELVTKGLVEEQEQP